MPDARGEALARNAEWLDRLRLSTPGQLPVFERLARLAADVTAFPIALVTFVSDVGQWNKGRHGFDRDFLPGEEAVCVQLLPADSLLQVPDTLSDPRFRHHPLVEGPWSIRAYAGQPVVFHDLPLGTVCVMDTVPRRLDDGQIAALSDVAEAVRQVLQNLDHQRHLEQERSRAIDFARASGDWFWELDHRLHYSWLSPNFHEQTGLDEGKLLHWPIGDAPVIPRLPDERATTLRELVNRRESFAGVVVELQIRGEPRLMSLSAIARRDEHGRFCGYRGSARDVTERVMSVRAAEAQALERERAERASEAKSAFLSRASHELRTPLNAIIGFSQLIRLEAADTLEPRVTERLTIIQQAADHLLAMVDDILDLSRLEMQPRLPVQPLDLCAVLDDCVAMLSLDIQRRGLRVDPPWCEAPVQVAAELSSLRRVLLNLLSNAVKYNVDGGRIRLFFEADSGQVRLVIEDTGCGIEPEAQAKLFEPFNRLGAERSAVPGTGLGLLIARGLARAMGGELEIRSQPGVGTAAVVTLQAA